MFSVMLAEILVSIYKKLWTDLLPPNTATKVQKVEANESDSLCHQNSVMHRVKERLTAAEKGKRKENEKNREELHVMII